MALPVSDTFTNSNGTNITVHDSNWTMNTGAMEIQSNALAANSVSAEQAAFWNGETWDNNQYSEGVLTMGGAASLIGVSVRHQGAGVASYYGFYAKSNATQLFRNVAGTWTQLGSSGAGPITGNTIRIEVSGTTLTPKINGATQSPPGAQTDSSFSSGKAGVTGYDDDGGVNLLDNWSSDSISDPTVKIKKTRGLRPALFAPGLGR